MPLGGAESILALTWRSRRLYATTARRQLVHAHSLPPGGGPLFRDTFKIENLFSIENLRDIKNMIVK